MENKKRGRDDHHRDQKKTTNNNRKKKRLVMTNMDNNDVGKVSDKFENTKNFSSRTEEYGDDEAWDVKGVFDFPWIKNGEDVTFRTEIDECLDNSIFAASTSSYDYDDSEILGIATTTTTTTTTSNLCYNALFDEKKTCLELDLDLDLDLIDQFFSGTTQSSNDDDDDDQLKMNTIEDEQLKIDDEKKLVEPKDGT